jgi:hypothetical protein
MAGQMLFDLIDPAELTQFVRTFDNEVLKPQARFVLSRFMPDLMVDELEYRVRRASLEDVDIAEYRSWDTPAPLTKRPGVSRIRGELGPISRGILLGEEETLRQRALDRDTNDPIINAIYDDVERMARSVRARIEIAVGDVINDGIVTIAENNLSLTANFGRAGAMSVTAGTVWTDVAAPILSNILGWMSTYEDTNGVTPGLLVVPRARLGNFALNTEMRNYAAANGTVPSRLNEAAINAVFAAEGIPPIFVYDGQFRKNGTLTRVLPANKVYLMPPAGEQLGNVFFGTTAEALRLREKGLIKREDAPGIVAFAMTQDHPVQTMTVATAVALPVMPNPNLVMDAIVTA